MSRSSSLRPIVFGGEGGATPLADGGLLLFRLFAGLSLALAHGLGKVPPSAGFMAAVSEMGFPLPGAFAWAAGAAELAGGVLLALGLFTRPASFFVGTTMAVAAFIQHGSDPFVDREKALLYLAAALLFLLVGAGRFSIDRLLYKKRDDRVWR